MFYFTWVTEAFTNMPGRRVENFNFISSLTYKQINSRVSLIVRVNVVLYRTVVIDSDWRFDNLYGSHLQSQSQQQQCYSGLPSPGLSNSTYFWNDSWVQTFHSQTNNSVNNVNVNNTVKLHLRLHTLKILFRLSRVLLDL